MCTHKALVSNFSNWHWFQRRPLDQTQSRKSRVLTLDGLCHCFARKSEHYSALEMAQLSNSGVNSKYNPREKVAIKRT